MRTIFLLSLMAIAVAMRAHAQTLTNPLTKADAALQAGEADRALALLNSVPVSAEVHNLKCRVQFALEHWDAAVGECEQAVEVDGQNSNYHLWLGRAFGEKAERASFITAFSLAKKVCAEFEVAVQLDPHNIDALSDLGEFYSEAPGVVGGGLDKAERVATQLDKLNRVQAHELRARIGESRKDYETAEREFKQAIAASQHPAFQWMTLASYYRRRQQWEDLDKAIDSGLSAVRRDKSAGGALFNGSTVLSRANRNLALSARMMEDYLASSTLTEDAPAFVALTDLARLRNQLGDKSGALQERARALLLAHDYKPALELQL